MSSELVYPEELHRQLCSILGSSNVYFQPPESVSMKYPAIVYARDDIENRHANDMVYGQSPSYSVTVIDEDPDSDIIEKVSQLPMCRFNRHYCINNLNHDVFTIYL